MKIAKKILATNLALMSAFAVSAAEPVEIEKPTDSPIITKNEKSTGKRIVKGIAIGVAGTLVVAAGVVAGLFVKDISETHKMDENGTFLDVSSKIFEWYSDPMIKSYIEKNKDTELGKALIDLFDVLDGKKLISKWRIIKSFKCVCRYMGISGNKSGCDELRRFLNESLNNGVVRLSLECLTPDSMLAECSHLPRNENIKKYSVHVGKFANFSKYNKGFMRVEVTGSNLAYDLRAIVIPDKKNRCFNAVVLKQEDEKWHMHSFGGDKGELNNDDLIIHMLENHCENVNLIYMKTC